jgi:hypothetical protein
MVYNLKIKEKLHRESNPDTPLSVEVFYPLNYGAVNECNPCFGGGILKNVISVSNFI